jgi:hypothetical protein
MSNCDHHLQDVMLLVHVARTRKGIEDVLETVQFMHEEIKRVESALENRLYKEEENEQDNS